MAVNTIGFLLIGGLHHILHLIPPAAELSKNDDLSVKIFVLTTEELDYCRRVMTGLGAGEYSIEILSLSSLIPKGSPKLSALWANRQILRRLDALVVAERTSTILRKLPGKLPLLIHIPHGAGDGPLGFDKRIRHFNHVIAAGQKDLTRMTEQGLISTSTRGHLSGYIKPFAVRHLSPKKPVFFANEKPVVLYNPHSKLELTSWTKIGKEMIKLFRDWPQFNFIFAPHTKLFLQASTSDRDSLASTFKADNILIDLGSARSTDMSYTRAADIYLGDVSSQVYEYLSDGPKPCVFLNAHGVNWRENPDYAHWYFGQVVSDVTGVIEALESAAQTLSDYREIQEQRIEMALGRSTWNPIKRAADIIHDLVRVN